MIKKPQTSKDAAEQVHRKYRDRYHESPHNVSPAYVYFGRDKAILREREKIKKLKIRQRRWQNQKQAE